MGSYNSRRMTEENSRESSSYRANLHLETESEYEDTGSDEDLIDSPILNIMHSIVATVRGIQFEGPYGLKFEKPNTSVLDDSEFSFITKQTSGVIDDGFKDLNLAISLSNRERGCYSYGQFAYPKRCRIASQYLPNEISILENSNGKVFCGIFSKDGNRFITASQDSSIRVYDSSTHVYKYLHSIRARDVGWSIIDVAFSPNGNNFVYSTWSSALHLCNVNENTDVQEPLTLLRSGRRFCVFSVVFSKNNDEILGGANDGCLYIYNLQRRDRTLRIPAHEYDVNSVRFADDSSDIIYSGGDDGVIRVWDRRTLDESNACAVGVLAGHMDGITFIDSRGDGRHLISNSKDQTIKLWDVRVFSGEKAAQKSLKAVHEQTWDYRWQEVPKKLYMSKNKLEGDSSVMTYQGHVVVKTLIRCRFSPKETTGQRYIYTGCGLGRLVVFDALTGKIIQSPPGHRSCVRDVDWHPTRNEILTSSWDGTVGKWSYVDHKALEEDECSDTENIDLDSSKRRSLRLAMKKKRSGR